MSWFWFLVIGGIAGWLAGKLTRGTGFGLLGDIIIGVIGALLGGFLFGLVGLVSFSLLGSLITATVGAIAFLYLVRLLKKV
ncbi:MAG: Transglycosylase-associated protein [Acidobacteria bacterium]|nr:Transglycosylase-associated protein [Acidobacteriota bacterium]